jgi:hypothetical protein
MCEKIIFKITFHIRDESKIECGAPDPCALKFSKIFQ